MRHLATTAAALGLALLSACSPGTTGTQPSPPTTTVTVEPTGSATTDPSDAPTTGVPQCVPAVRADTVQYRSIDGVDPNLLSLDVHAAPDGCAAPVVVWVHGGGYRGGDKANQMRDKVRLAREQGWVLVSVNYRLTDPAAATPAQFPDHYDDVAHALAWVHDHIAEHGGDPERIAVLGHSAGADIVANVLTVPTYLDAVGMRLKDVVCAGPLDTAGFDKTARGLDAEERMWEAALGNNPDYRTATSATLQVRPGIGIPPMIGVVRGNAPRRAVEEAFLDALANAGIRSVRIDAATLTHGEVNSRIGAPDDTVMTPPIVEFLGECFVG